MHIFHQLPIALLQREARPAKSSNPNPNPHPPSGQRCLLNLYNRLQGMQKNQNQRANSTIIIEMNNQFPFGSQSGKRTSYDERKRIFVRKAYPFRTEKERRILLEKVNALKDMYHRNVINMRNAEETGGTFTIFYHYVHASIDSAFPCLTQSTFKEVHKQLIQLAIHLAKNYVLTSFNPSRCGVVFLDDKFVIKYFLPLSEIVITQNRSMLERSVQLFKVQAMHMLDTLCHHDILSDLSSHSEQEIHFQQPGREKHSMLLSTGRGRRMSNQTAKQRKFSNMGSKLDQIARKKSQDSSTYFTGVRISGLKSTLKNFKIQSQRKRTSEKSKQKTRERVELLKMRSEKAIRAFRVLQKEMKSWVGLARLIRLCNQL